MEQARAWAEVDLDAMTSNLEALRDRVGHERALILVVKADAYGHGAVPVAHHATAVGVDALGVTTPREAMELRRAGVRTRTIVLGPALGGEVQEALEDGVEFCIPSAELFEELAATARRLGLTARVHLKIDTGMARLGVTPDEAPGLLSRIQGAEEVALAGVMTHLAALDGALDPRAHLQMAAFRRVLESARANRLLAGDDVWVHAANSAGALSGLDPLYDAVRVGIGAYGVAPSRSVPARDLAPVLSVRTRVVHVRELARGQAVGYGGTWTAQRPSRVAVLPVGYDDGISWRLSNNGTVLVRGQRAPIVGRISMDYTTIDVTDVVGPGCVGRGEVVTLIGADGTDRIRVEDLSRRIGTIPYEVTCGIGKRVERTYVGTRVRQAPALVV